MIYEYAVSPNLFGNPANLNFLFESFKFGSGRIISDYPRKEWVKYVRACIKGSVQEESERNAWIELLILLHKNNLLFERQGPLWDEQINWVMNAINEHHRRPFRGILNDKKVINEPDVISVGPSIHSHSKWEVSSTRSIPRRAAELVQSVADLINMSNKLILIDRNFDPSEGYFSKVLVAFADYLLKVRTHQPKIQQIKFVTTYEDYKTKETKEQFENRCRKYLPELLPSGIQVKFHLKVKNLLHPRFVLTNIGGVLFDWGLDENDGKPTIISRLSIDNFNLEWKQWDKNVIHEFTILGLKN
ncbi:MAG: hypothetical protein WAV07_13820 [Candidatus Contendobacter sp.]